MKCVAHLAAGKFVIQKTNGTSDERFDWSQIDSDITEIRIALSSSGEPILTSHGGDPEIYARFNYHGKSIIIGPGGIYGNFPQESATWQLKSKRP